MFSHEEMYLSDFIMPVSKIFARRFFYGSKLITQHGSGKHWSHLYPTPVKIMTYEKIKGQQFETVFLFVSGELSAEMVKRFYVGVTRAERFLYVLYTDPMPSVLRQIPEALYSTTDEVGDFTGLYQGVKAESHDEMPNGASVPKKGSVDVGF